MSAITPDSYVKLVRFDVTKEHQITFSNLTAQLNYFENLSGLELQASTYQRKEGKVRFPAVIDELEQYNYLIYRNDSDTTPNYYNDKTFFCYITDMSYINDNMTEITIVQDVFQTWQFDFIYKQCFVEREHVNDDTVGKHTIPETLETGDYIQNDVVTFDEFNRTCFIVQASKVPTSTPTTAYGTAIAGMVFAGYFMICLSYTDVTQVVQEYTTRRDLGFDSIINIYMVPYCLTPNYLVEPNPPAAGQRSMPDSYSVNSFFKNITIPSSIDGYTPVNKKLLTKDYNYLLVSNNNGVAEAFNYENFVGTECEFMVVGMPSLGGQISLWPLNYGNGSGMFYDMNKIAGGKYPPTDYIKDNYQIWLRQNALNLQLGIAGGIVEAGIGIGRTIAGDYEGLVSAGSGIGTIFGNMLSKYMHSKVPPTLAGNTNIGDLNVAQKANGFSFTQMCIKKEYAKIIDKFFTMFGYKVNDRKIPNITGRLNWNYVKTNNAIVESSSVPEKYLNEYKQMLNNGITFWHNPSTFLDYSQSNSIV